MDDADKYFQLYITPNNLILPSMPVNVLFPFKLQYTRSRCWTPFSMPLITKMAQNTDSTQHRTSFKVTKTLVNSLHQTFNKCSSILSYFPGFFGHLQVVLSNLFTWKTFERRITAAACTWRQSLLIVWSKNFCTSLKGQLSSPPSSLHKPPSGSHSPQLWDPFHTVLQINGQEKISSVASLLLSITCRQAHQLHPHTSRQY